MVNKTIKSMSITGERSAEMEDNIQDKIREMKQRSAYSQEKYNLTFLSLITIL